jgi:hypothetical protein
MKWIISILLCILPQLLLAQRIGFEDSCNSNAGWMERSPAGKLIEPTLLIKSQNGQLIIHHKHRSLEQAYKKYGWINTRIDYSTTLEKTYRTIDLDRYHYVVLDIASKGSNSYFSINGYSSKLGYTTGITAIDLKDYADSLLHGKRRVCVSIDLQDNHTELVINSIRFCSSLVPEEKARLIGRGLSIHEEDLPVIPYYGLQAIHDRRPLNERLALYEPLLIFRDPATHALITRLTAAKENEFFGEGGIWSANGQAIKFEAGKNNDRCPLFLPGQGRKIWGPAGTIKNIWDPENPDILYGLLRHGLHFTVIAWSLSGKKASTIASFEAPEMGSYVEFQYNEPRHLQISFRETPHLFLVDLDSNKVQYFKLSTRLKDAHYDAERHVITWYNCYTFEGHWKNLLTGSEGLEPSFSAGHSSHGKNAMVANFGGHLNILVPHSLHETFTPGNGISVWANWENDIVTDYGNLSYDNKFVFTNGTKGDVDHQHLMIPSCDPGAIMRIVRYFTRFTWESTTYSRPSPDYTKLVYNENIFGNTDLYMAYTKLPDPPLHPVLIGKKLSWNKPENCQETAGYNVYASNETGSGFERINDSLIRGRHFAINNRFKYYRVTAVEFSGLESNWSSEVANSDKSCSLYFEAENLDLKGPARHFFDGDCQNFQCIRITPESPEEENEAGSVLIPPGAVPDGRYTIWIRAKGKGTWKVGSHQLAISTNEWEWQALAYSVPVKSADILRISSTDNNLMLDRILITTGDFKPHLKDPCDEKAPGTIGALRATNNGDIVKISWSPVSDRDLHHYSVYCGYDSSFVCDNKSIIRSVNKNTVSDLPPAGNRTLYYKIIAVDSRWNKSVPAIISVTRNNYEGGR